MHFISFVLLRVYLYLHLPGRQGFIRQHHKEIDFMLPLAILCAFAQPLMGQLVITEVNSTQDSKAVYAEILNTGTGSVDVADFTVTFGNDGSDRISNKTLNNTGYTNGLVLHPGEYLLLLRDLATFKTNYPGIPLNETGTDDQGNTLVEYFSHGWLYLNGGVDYIIIKNGGGGTVDRFNSSTDWTDNHCFERIHYPNDGTDLSQHWLDLGLNQIGTPASPNDSSLPVELAVFDAKIREKGVELIWQTESETDNLGFKVQRANTELGPYQNISPLIKGANTSTESHRYSYFDDRIEGFDQLWYQLEQIDIDGTVRHYGPIKVELQSQQDTGYILPKKTMLLGNYPNPFNPQTKIHFFISEPNEHISLDIFDRRGRHTKTLVNRYMGPGSHTITWQGEDKTGMTLPSGVYFCRLAAGAKGISTIKMVKLD